MILSPTRKELLHFYDSVTVVTAFPGFRDNAEFMRDSHKAFVVAAAWALATMSFAQGLLNKDLSRLSIQHVKPQEKIQPLTIKVQSPPQTSTQTAAHIATVVGAIGQLGIGLGVLFVTRLFKRADILADFQRRYDNVLDRVYNASSASEPISGLQARLLATRYWNLQNDQWIAYVNGLLDAGTFKQWMDDRLLSYQSDAPSFKISIQEAWDVAGSEETHKKLVDECTALSDEDKETVIKNPHTKDVVGVLPLTTKASFLIYQGMTVPDKANPGRSRHSYPDFISHMEEVVAGNWQPRRYWKRVGWRFLRRWK